METKGARLIGRYLLLGVLAFVVLFPIYAAIIAAFKPGNEVFQHPLLPGPFTFDTLRDAWDTGNLGRALVVSTVVAVIVTVAQVVTSVLAAYAFAFLRFPLKPIVFGLFIATLLIPFEATVVVNRRTVEDLGWLNSFQGLTVPFLATAFGTFLIRQVFVTLPGEMRDAARMDGLGHWGFMREVAVPLIRPSVAALALFSFLATWNQYLWPTLITTDQDWNTVQSGLRSLQQANLDQPNLVIGGTVIVAIPIFVLLLVFQKHLIRGLTAGAVKG
jgi:sn-glycerol 3-phosphate transport system permease protein